MANGVVGAEATCVTAGISIGPWRIRLTSSSVPERAMAELLDDAVECFLGSRVTGGAFAMGRDKPRSLPRLATPTPQVSCVL